MFSSIFSSGDPKAPNFHPITSSAAGFSPLEDADLKWTCAGGFSTETQTFYQFNEDGTFIMLQVIHASVGVWFPTIQFVVHVYDPKTKERIWSSTNVSGFSADGRSCKASEFSIVHNPPSKPTVPGTAESYTITARPNKDVQVSVTVSRTDDAPGWKYGKDGKSFFGPNLDKPEGYVVHRFWPRTSAKGHIVYKGKAITVDAVGMLVHAIQGMRPNLVAARWNFAHFQARNDPKLGAVSAIMMEFTTTRAFGPAGKDSGNVKVNVGSVVVGGKLVLVTGETQLPTTGSSQGAIVSRATHLDPELDKDTSYRAPSRIAFDWAGASLSDKTPVKAHLEVVVGSPHNMKGLVEKVDVLAEVPGAVKGVVNYVAGVKPYIYQWVNPAKLTIRAPGEEEETTVEGWLNNEATFISEP